MKELTKDEDLTYSATKDKSRYSFRYTPAAWAAFTDNGYGWGIIGRSESGELRVYYLGCGLLEMNGLIEDCRSESGNRDELMWMSLEAIEDTVFHYIKLYREKIK